MEWLCFYNKHNKFNNVEAIKYYDCDSIDLGQDWISAVLCNDDTPFMENWFFKSPVGSANKNSFKNV